MTEKVSGVSDQVSGQASRPLASATYPSEDVRAAPAPSLSPVTCHLSPPVPPDYRICTRCVMDTSDPGIEFDARGVCNRCRDFEARMATILKPGPARDRTLAELVERIKAEGRGKEYDCIIGVSGGVDSTYVAYVVKQMLGLRPLAVHLDNGWDAELAVANIEKCLKKLSIDLYTHVLDWDEFRELQLAMLKASTPDSEVPTDHAIWAVVRKKAAQERIRYILLGNNMATEGIAAPGWSMGQMDWKYIREINRRFGSRPLKTFPHLTLWDEFRCRYLLRQQVVSILDYVDYHKEQALETLARELGYVRYRGKHHESVYTRFFQSYILPVKFGYDKRRAHLSPLIMSGQITRPQALEEMKKPIESPGQLREDKVFVAKKLGISEREFDAIMALPKKRFWDFPSYEKSPLVRLHRQWRARRLPPPPVEAESAARPVPELETGAA